MESEKRRRGGLEGVTKRTDADCEVQFISTNLAMFRQLHVRRQQLTSTCWR